MRHPLAAAHVAPRSDAAWLRTGPPRARRSRGQPRLGTKWLQSRSGGFDRGRSPVGRLQSRCRRQAVAAAEERSTPETSTTARHAASTGLARSWRCGWSCASIGPVNFPELPRRRIAPRTSVPNSDAWRVPSGPRCSRRLIHAGAMRFTIGMNRYLSAAFALRVTLVAVAAPGETAYTAMPGAADAPAPRSTRR